jgi:hypothetical protein
MNIMPNLNRTTVNSTILAAVSLLPGLFVVKATGQSTGVRAITLDLKTITGKLELLDEQRLSIRQEDGSTRTVIPDEIAFIEFSDTLENAVPDGKISNGLLQLVDGTRYTGWSDVIDDRFVWLNWWSGTVHPEIDTIVSFDKKGGLFEVGTDETEDLVLLVNGDRLTGLVLDITDSVEIERTDSSRVSVPVDRVDYLSLVNPITEESGVRAWLTRGDEVIINSYRFDVGTGLRIPGREPLMPNYLYAIAFDSDRITPLADQSSRAMGLPDSDRYLIPEPEIDLGAWPLDAPPIELQGPMRVEWQLPEEGMGFTATAVIPPPSRRHGNFELVIFDGDKEIRTFRMNDSTSKVDITVLFETRRLSIELREGTMGPIQNHLRLERALLIHPEKP